LDPSYATHCQEKNQKKVLEKGILILLSIVKAYARISSKRGKVAEEEGVQEGAIGVNLKKGIH